MTEVLLAVSGVHKRFSGVHALKGVSFDVLPGEIHALVGENGAGKSTLMRVIAGAHAPDEGRIFVDGREAGIASPADSFDLGIAMVYQDTRLVPTLDAAANIALGREPGRLLVDLRKLTEDARAMLAGIGSDVDLRRPAGDLSRAERQQVEIARALSRNARILILDEPTSALTASETEQLFVLLKRLRAEGRGIVFISHRLPEIMALADRVTVMKDGEVVGTVPIGETSPDRLVAMMVGRSVDLVYPARAETVGEPLLAVRALRVHDRSPELDFVVRKGEILGLAGVQGGGQQAVARALFGVGEAGSDMVLDGKRYAPASPAEAIAAGVVYVPADRHAESLFLPHTIRENVALPEIARFAPTGLLSAAGEREAVAEQTMRLAVKAPSIEQPVFTLSGGNQQKVVFARWFLASPRIFIFDEPTQGVDVATKLELYRLIRQLAAQGAGVIVVSADLIELINLSDRILVFSEGHIVDQLPAAEATEERLVAGFTRGAGAGAATASPAQRRQAAERPMLARYTPTVLLTALVAAIILGTAFATPYFLTPRNFASIANQAAPLIIAALGQLAVILLGGIDLSVGPVISLVTAIASHLLAPASGLPIPLGLAACLMTGLLVGIANGLVIEKLRIPDLVATLATFSIVQGLALIVRPAPGGGFDADLGAAILARWGYLPLVFLAAIVLALAFELLLLRGRIGARLYATGASPEAAKVVGISPGRVRIAAYAFSGLMASLAGLVIAARIGSGDPQAGSAFTLASVTAVVVGGTPIFGGSGTASGTFAGALLVMLIQNVLNQLHVSAYWQYIWTGALTLAAVCFFALREKTSRAVASRWLRRMSSGR
ncbi:ATP-binding cassette domain-containing protein [Mesorhizobium captivum]|uniref:ATP-binding cassette domain-containing protein n=1 Tax=Mesorhizobium captivum TaxID=3072319 RepID=UPI002A244252|nr:ATP-binding cassette domain-containing protein [Mesorhizobium sp. VK23E]MDX8515221.1 ATP-binding cassette domain-containing protein [Mesorhizobium sp. VK23E]